MRENVLGEKSVQNFVAERGIKYLVHFTRIENLISVLSNGLIPVASLFERGIDCVTNDLFRYDGCEDATCLSIQFPNYKMFYKYRVEFPESEWVVLGINKQVLWEKDCVFCSENAASATMFTMPIVDRKGVEGLKKLYEDYPGKPSRQELNIKDNYPTNPQAEVLVFDIIQPELILGVAFKSNEQLDRYKHLMPPTVKASVNPKLYSYRNDFEHWRA